MTEAYDNGTRRRIEGRERIYFDGYWIKYYAPPADSLAEKKRLIHALTRRLFNHVEHGINIPGVRLQEARAAYEAATDGALKRVKGAMLAGALFNRAADIFSCLVDLQERGVQIDPDNSLMRECGSYLIQALEFGKSVRHRNGDESIDELWGEPFKAFSIPIDGFYESRYIKIAQTMRNIDAIGAALIDTLEGNTLFPNAAPLIRKLIEAAKRKAETLRTDPAIFDVWPALVVAGERLCQMEPSYLQTPSKAGFRLAEQGCGLIRDGQELVVHIARARVPMPKSTTTYLERCERYRRDWIELTEAA
jgi:hypothetical protein